jgi:DNA (cytosine-5)-methyltransferase 1
VLRSVELFAGGGGMALGMRAADFQHVQLVEHDPRACDILRANARRTPELWAVENVRQMDILDWLKEIDELQLDGIDLVAGGPPCQPFSVSGDHAGHNDDRNMFPAAIETVRRLRPKLFVFENVPGLMRESFLPYYQYIEDQLSKPEVAPGENEPWEGHHRRVKKARREGLTYHVGRHVINAADLGVAQMRQRVFLVGIRADLGGADSSIEVRPTHGPDALIRAKWITGSYWEEYSIGRPPHPPPRLKTRIKLLQTGDLVPPLERWRTVRDAIADLPAPVDYTESADVLNHWGIPGARTYDGHTGSDFDWPAKAIKAGVHGVCGGEAMIRFDDGSVRYLTIREAARVQSFRDDYEIPGTRTAAMRAVGNAVAMEVARLIGTRLRDLATKEGWVAATAAASLRDGVAAGTVRQAVAAP